MGEFICSSLCLDLLELGKSKFEESSNQWVCGCPCANQNYNEYNNSYLLTLRGSLVRHWDGATQWSPVQVPMGPLEVYTIVNFRT